MADSKDLIIKRKEAYEYIKNTLRHPPWNIPLDISDAQLADVLGGTWGLETALVLLKEGKANPSPDLVKTFKALAISSVVPESRTDQYLVDPFR